MAKIFAILIWILTALNFYDGISFSSVKYMFCFFPNTALLFGIQIMFQFERSGKSSIHKTIDKWYSSN